MNARQASFVASASLLVALLVACGDDAGETTQPSATTTTTTPSSTTAPPGQVQECVSPAGYRVEYPATWSTNDPSQGFPCRFFHPEPFTLPSASEATGVAIRTQMVPTPVDEVAPPPEGSLAVDVLDRQETRVAERRALRVETRSTGDGLLPAGTRGVSHYVDFGARTLLATTSETASAGTFEANVEVLDDMMASARAADRTSTCSADAGASMATPQPELPDPVAAMRQSIVAAAARCDYEELARLAQADGQFTYSFGGGEDPAGYWRRTESDGEPVMAILVELLERPFATRTADGSTQYLWPSAYVYESWAGVPKEDREALRPLYGDEDFRRFEQFGSYAGYRVGISGDDWLFFVGGD